MRLVLVMWQEAVLGTHSLKRVSMVRASRKKLVVPSPNHQTHNMATVFTARNIVGNDKTTPLFSLKGLPNQVPATISSLNISGVPLERQVAYQQYASNISSFLHATMARKTITVTPRPLGYPESYIPLQMDPPVTSFTLAKPLSTDQADKLVGNLGPGASRTMQGKTMVFHAPALPIDRLPLVDTVSTSFFNAGRDAVNPKGMRSYLFLNTVISAFLHVHSYSAFRTENSESITVFEELVGGIHGSSYYPAVTESKDDKGAATKKTADLSDKSYTLNEWKKRERSEDDMDDEEPPMKVADSSGYFRSRGNETVFKAKPAPKALKSSIGGSKDVPSSPGLLFPYFTGLVQPDPTYMNTIVLRRFYQLLGSSHESAQSTYLDIRHGINSLASTQRGMELCHILLGIDLALDTQSRCFVIIEKNKYLGFSLLGARYAIFANSKWFAPASEEIFLQALSRMDPHESAVDDIIQKLEKLAESSSYAGQINRTIFAEPSTLVEELSKLKVSELEDEDVRDLDRLIKNLNYMGTGYLSQNPQMISEMLTTLASNQTIDLTRPTFIPSIKAPLTSRTFKVLSRFGPEAPSFWNDRGQEIMCKAVDKSVQTTGGKRKIGEPDIFGNMPSRLLITPKPLLIAVRDMDRVIDSGKVKMDIKERAAKYRNISLEHEETRKSVWKGLVELCAKETKKVKVSSEAKGAEGGGVAIDEALFQLLGQ